MREKERGETEKENGGKKEVIRWYLVEKVCEGNLEDEEVVV